MTNYSRLMELLAKISNPTNWMLLVGEEVDGVSNCSMLWEGDPKIGATAQELLGWLVDLQLEGLEE